MKTKPFAVGLVVVAGALALASGLGSGYPPAVTKTLYAKVDLRGKQGPKIKVDKWLTGHAPKTKGKVVLIDFWATWCPPCRATIPELGKWQKAHPKELVVIGITSETADVVRKFMKTTPMPYNVALDAKNRTSDQIGVEGIPHVLVISPDGIVRWQGFPLDEKDPLTDQKLDDILREAKSEAK